MLRRALPVVLLVASIALPAHATVVAPGASVPPSPIAADSPLLAGTTLQTHASPFSLSLSWGYPTMTGTLHSRAVRTDAGTLDFYYQVLNLQQTPAPGETFPISLFHSFTIQGFAGLQTDVYAITPGGGVVPGSVSRSSGGGDLTAVFINEPFTYPYSYPLHAGVDSVQLLLRTNATDYQQAPVSLVGSAFDLRSPGSPSNAAGAATALVPPGEVFAVPEPASALLLPLAAGALLLRVRRRR